MIDKYLVKGGLSRQAVIFLICMEHFPAAGQCPIIGKCSGKQIFTLPVTISLGCFSFQQFICWKENSNSGLKTLRKL